MPFFASRDADQATWWADALHPFARDVGSVIPDVFPAYVRVLHPVDDAGRRRSWTEIAAENGRIAHPQMQLHEISRARGAQRRPRPAHHAMDRRVSWGSLPKAELEALAELLARHTATPDTCWCCVWQGYGQMNAGAAPGARMVPPLVPGELLDGERVSVPNRSYYVLRGPLAELGALHDLLWRQSPNVWWPDDRTWCAATEIDCAWTYVGGGAAAIEAILADRRLEALPARPADRFAYDSDVVNAALDGR
jgi:hypothetical protein